MRACLSAVPRTTRALSGERCTLLISEGDVIEPTSLPSATFHTLAILSLEATMRVPSLLRASDAIGPAWSNFALGAPSGIAQVWTVLSALEEKRRSPFGL